MATVLYNVPSAFLHAVRAVTHDAPHPWFVILADLPSREEDWALHEAQLSEADGRIYLSWLAYLRGKEPKLHLDGGVVATKPRPAGAKRKALLYSGTLTRYGGVDRLCQGFRMLEDPDLELWICGKGDSRYVEAMAAEDRRIRYFGTVDDARLDELSRQCFAFVNPRPPDLGASEWNFPSKVLEYLTYGKPVVSTWTPGLAPEYEEVLFVARDGTPAGLAASITEVLALDEARLSRAATTAHAFLQQRRTWHVQAARLSNFLRSSDRRP